MAADFCRIAVEARGPKSAEWSFTRRALLAGVWAASAEGVIALPATAEWEIQLTLTPGPGVAATLRNQGTAAGQILHDPNLQPSRLVLTNSEGVEADPFDERARRNVDRTVRGSMFVRVPAGGSLALGSDPFERSEGGYSIGWGPFRYHGLKPGEWTVQVTFMSLITEAIDGKVAGAFKGSIASNQVKVVLR